MLATMLAIALAGAPAAKPEPVDVQVVVNETDVAASAGDQAIALLRTRGYRVAPKVAVGELPARKRKAVRRVLTLEVLRPATCYVLATLVETDGDKTTFTWQTKNDRDPCGEQVGQMVEALAAKAPPAR